MDDYFAMIVPDRTESIATPWVKLVIRNLLWSRGGCVFFMDYSSFANVANNNALTPHITGIATVLLKKFDQIGHYNKQYCFGFGVGSRLCVAAGLMIGNQTFDRMDLCDPAGLFQHNLNEISNKENKFQVQDSIMSIQLRLQKVSTASTQALMKELTSTTVTGTF